MTTNNRDIIKKAYWDLVKIYHPDKANTPEKVRKNTIKCAEINVAYKEALKQSQQEISREDVSVATKATEKPYPWYYNAFSFSLMVISLISIAVFLGLLGIIMGEIGSLPDQNLLKIMCSVIVIFLTSSFVVGFCIIGTFDMIIIYLFPSNLLPKFGLEKYENKIMWFLITFANIIIFYVFGFGDFLLDREDPMRHLYTNIFKAVGTSTIPIWLLSDWMREIMIFKKLKKQHFQIIINEE